MVGIAAALGLVAAQSASAPACELYWQEMHTGKGHAEHVYVPPVTGLSWLSARSPSRSPTERATRKPSSGTTLRWSRLDPPVAPEHVGVAEGHRLYRLTYAPWHFLLVWERSPGVFCPFAMLETDEEIANGYSTPTVFNWRRRQVIAFRIYSSGMGALQRSLMFAFVQGVLVHLRDDDDQFRRVMEEQKGTMYHRDGGFCEGTLVWQNWAGHDDTEARSGAQVFRVVYAIRGKHLVVQSAHLVPNDNPAACRHCAWAGGWQAPGYTDCDPPQ
jgi:hypothetical protein